MVAVPGPSPSTAHAVYNSGGATPADGQAIPLQIDNAGNLKVSVGGSGGGSVSTNVAQVGGTAVDAATASAGALAVIDLGTDAVPVFPGAPTTPWSYAAASGGIVDATALSIKAAPAGALRNYITSAQIINTDATVGTEVVFTDGSGGAVLWRGFAPASIALVTQPSMVDLKFVPPLFTSAATALFVQCVTTSSQTYVNAQGYVK